MRVPTFAEKLAVRLLARDGISAVWQLHLAAATAYRDGYKRAAETVLEIANAAEREVLERAHNSF
jgi:hypothetical protein